MLKVDVAIQSYKKPESLLYTLMCLKECSGDRIDTVYINDDCSGENAAQLYTGTLVRDYFQDWNIRFRRNTRPVRWRRLIVRGYRPSYMTPWYYFLGTLSCLARQRRYLPKSDDVRYQWALNSTDKDFVFLTHDDVEYTDDVIGLYLDAMTPDTAIVGDLGQCWRCRFGDTNDSCSAQRIMRGEHPWEKWPLTDSTHGPERRNCRINEWCCMIRTSAAHEITKKEKCFFGNYDDFGDVGAYWFEQAIKHEYRFCDPLPKQSLRKAYYKHCWQGHPGAHVRRGQVTYKRDFIRERTLERFGCTLL
jgi:hypothetical protein